MNREEIIQYWIESSDGDFKTMKNLFKTKDYTWSLFMGHLVIEKLIKACYVKNNDTNIPFSHNLIYLSNKTGINLDEKTSNVLSDLTTFNIAARYDDYKSEFKKICTRAYAEKYIAEIGKLRKWLKEQIKK